MQFLLELNETVLERLKIATHQCFKKLFFFKLMMRYQLQISKPCLINSTGNIHFPFVLVVDEAFGLSEHVMRSYAGYKITKKKKTKNK